MTIIEMSISAHAARCRHSGRHFDVQLPDPAVLEQVPLPPFVVQFALDVFYRRCRSRFGNSGWCL
jgi:hypothetical protein